MSRPGLPPSDFPGGGALVSDEGNNGGGGVNGGDDGSDGEGSFDSDNDNVDISSKRILKARVITHVCLKKRKERYLGLCCLSVLDLEFHIRSRGAVPPHLSSAG